MTVSYVTGLVTTDMAWSVGCAPMTAAYAWDDANVTVYCWSNSMSTVSAFSVLRGTSSRWLPGPTWPTARSNAVFVFLSHWQRLILFSGQDSNNNLLSETWVFDPTPGVSSPFFLLNITGPPARFKAAAGAFDQGSKLFIFGGSNGTENFPDFWRLDVTEVGMGTMEAQWTSVHMFFGPSRSSWDASLAISGKSMYVFGLQDWAQDDYSASAMYTLDLSGKDVHLLGDWNSVTIDPKLEGRYLWGMAPNLASYSNYVLLGPGYVDSSAVTVAQELLMIDSESGDATVVLSGRPEVSQAAALFVSEDQARAYLFQANATYFVALDQTTCSWSVTCPEGMVANPSPVGLELNYATCCIALASSTAGPTAAAGTTGVLSGRVSGVFVFGGFQHRPEAVNFATPANAATLSAAICALANLPLQYCTASLTVSAGTSRRLRRPRAPSVLCEFDYVVSVPAETSATPESVYGAIANLSLENKTSLFINVLTAAGVPNAADIRVTDESYDVEGTSTTTTTVATSTTAAWTNSAQPCQIYVASVYSSLVGIGMWDIYALAIVTGLDASAISCSQSCRSLGFVDNSSSELPAHLGEPFFESFCYKIQAPDPSVATKITAPSLQATINALAQAEGYQSEFAITSFFKVVQLSSQGGKVNLGLLIILIGGGIGAFLLLTLSLVLIWRLFLRKKKQNTVS